MRRSFVQRASPNREMTEKRTAREYGRASMASNRVCGSAMKNSIETAANSWFETAISRRYKMTEDATIASRDGKRSENSLTPKNFVQNHIKAGYNGACCS